VTRCEALLAPIKGALDSAFCAINAHCLQLAHAEFSGSVNDIVTVWRPWWNHWATWPTCLSSRLWLTGPQTFVPR